MNDRDSVDPIYGGGRENGRLTPIVNFDYGLIDGTPEPETTISVAEATGALTKILDWAARSQNCTFIGAKVLALRALLGSPNNPFRSVARIAAEAGVTRASLSHALLRLASDYGIRLNTGKLERSRTSFRLGQLRAVQRGTHVSQKKKSINEGNDMNSQQIRQQFNTLSKAVDEIERLQQQLDSRGTTAPKTATAPPKQNVQRSPVTIARTTQKTPLIPPAPELADLNRKELLEVLDAASHDGNQLGCRSHQRRSREGKRAGHQGSPGRKLVQFNSQGRPARGTL